MSKLKIKLYNEGNVVVYRVLEQCDSLKAQKGEILEFVASNEFEILSNAIPLMTRCKQMYLRGYNHLGDEGADTIIFESEREAEKYIEQALFALQEWKENGYFEGKKDNTSQDGVHDIGKLKFKLYNEGNAVIFRVLEQSENVRASNYQSLIFESSTGFKVASKVYPGIYANRINLRGCDREEDNSTVVEWVEDEDTAISFVKEALNALREWKENGYFEGKKESENEEGVYEF